MNKQVLTFITFLGIGTLTLTGCAGANSKKHTKEMQSSKTTKVAKSSTEDETTKLPDGATAMKILASTNWQGTKVYDKQHHDLTKENQEFIGLAKYDDKTGQYEFFNKKTGQSRGDAGIFFVTADGNKRVLISQTKNYQAVVDLTEVSKDKFTYKRTGKDENGQPTEVYVEHIPYKKTQLSFSSPAMDLNTTTGKIQTDTPGREILGDTLWQGQKVVDQNGNDVTEQNKMFISLAKFDAKTNKYEFFDLNSGQPKGDFGYFDVLNNNKIRAHASIGQNKYGAVLELTELNPQKFTYKRLGKDQAGNQTIVYVEHVPYTGNFNPAFTF